MFYTFYQMAIFGCRPAPGLKKKSAIREELLISTFRFKHFLITTVFKYSFIKIGVAKTVRLKFHFSSFKSDFENVAFLYF